MRDLRGYAGRWPDLRWPGGARLAVSVVVNFEEGPLAAVAMVVGDRLVGLRRLAEF